MKYMALYNSAISELLEGRREVMQDKRFRFEDGQTVEDKVSRVESVMKQLVAKTEKQLKKMENRLNE